MLVIWHCTFILWVAPWIKSFNSHGIIMTLGHFKMYSSSFHWQVTSQSTFADSDPVLTDSYHQITDDLQGLPNCPRLPRFRSVPRSSHRNQHIRPNIDSWRSIDDVDLVRLLCLTCYKSWFHSEYCHRGKKWNSKEKGLQLAIMQVTAFKDRCRYFRDTTMPIFHVVATFDNQVPEHVRWLAWFQEISSFIEAHGWIPYVSVSEHSLSRG